MDLQFTIAKKVSRPAPGSKGITLSSLQEEGGDASWIINAKKDVYDQIREDAEAFSLVHDAPVKCRFRGSSFEVFGKGRDVAEFAKGIAFNTEEAKDVAEILCELETADAFAAYKKTSAKLDKSSLEVNVSIELREGQTAESIYAELSDFLDKYGLGILKPNGTQV